MSEYIKHILERVEKRELTSSEAYNKLYPYTQKSIRSGVKIGRIGTCWYCGEKKETNKDHFWPKSKGGRLTVPSCYECNFLKKARTPLQWAEFIQLRVNSNLIEKKKGERIINATISLWEKLESKPS
jgi:5-methylcytosine-specific restriction endonuclease McrA